MQRVRHHRLADVPVARNAHEQIRFGAEPVLVPLLGRCGGLAAGHRLLDRQWVVGLLLVVIASLRVLVGLLVQGLYLLFKVYIVDLIIPLFKQEARLCQRL